MVRHKEDCWLLQLLLLPDRQGSVTQNTARVMRKGLADTAGAEGACAAHLPVMLTKRLANFVKTRNQRNP
jgi:hypothetical protein